MKILVVGATGYVGGRLVPRLVDDGHEVTVLVRDERRFIGRPGSRRVKIIEGDVRNYDDCVEAVAGCDVAYYLVHSLRSGKDYGINDRIAATNFSNASRRMKQVIYIGGIQPTERSTASKHLASRAEVGEILGRYQNLTEFRAGPIVGSGSASFEMVRYLTERLPIMVTPRWVDNQVQPIAIRDVLSYLMTAVEHEPLGVINIGMEAVSFGEMLLIYAEERGLKRRLFKLPILAPNFASRWVGLITPISKDLAIPIVEGIVYPLIGDNTRAKKHFPKIVPLDYRSSVRLALKRIHEGNIETRWSGSLNSDENNLGFVDREGIFREIRSRKGKSSPEALFKVLSQIGGDRGWMTWQWAWRLRGWLDQLLGGPGLRRGRRNPNQLWVGEVVDFWRVEIVEENVRLRLKAEMKMPGEAWLDWEIRDLGNGETELIQRAYFIPKGLWGAIYWYAVYPAHLFIFPGMLRAIFLEADRWN